MALILFNESLRDSWLMDICLVMYIIKFVILSEIFDSPLILFFGYDLTAHFCNECIYTLLLSQNACGVDPNDQHLSVTTSAKTQTEIEGAT